MSEAPARRAGRKALITPEMIVGAALVVMLRDGLDAVTIRTVAAELSVKSASLYWHFATKAALLDRLADEVLAGLDPVSPTDDWRADLRESALRLFRHLCSRRDAGRLRAGRLVTGPHTLRWMEAGLTTFRRAGLAPIDAAFASHATNVYVLGSVIFAQTPLSARHAGGASAADALGEARGLFVSLPAEAFPNLTAMAAALTEGGAEARFLYGLDDLIAGIVDRKARRTLGQTA